MAAKLGEGVQRRDSGSIPYDELKGMRWDRDVSRRKPKLKSDPETRALAQSIAEKGQLQPILYRLDSEDKPVGLAGRRRFMAVELIGEDPQSFNLSAPIPLLAQKVTATDEDAFTITLEENVEKASLTETDIAYCADHLLNVEHWTRERVCEKLRLTPKGLTLSQKLLKLPGSALDLIDAGRLTAKDARKFLGIAEDQIKDYAKQIKQASEDEADSVVSGILREIKTSKVKAGKRVRPMTSELLKQVDAALEDPAMAEFKDVLGAARDVLSGRSGAMSFIEVLTADNIPEWTPEPEPEKKAKRVPLTEEEKAARAAKAAEDKALKAKEREEKKAQKEAEKEAKRQAAREKRQAEQLAKRAATPKKSKKAAAPKSSAKKRKAKGKKKATPVRDGEILDTDETGEVFISQDERDIFGELDVEAHDVLQALGHDRSRGAWNC